MAQEVEGPLQELCEAEKASCVVLVNQGVLSSCDAAGRREDGIAYIPSLPRTFAPGPHVDASASRSGEVTLRSE